MLKPDLKRVKLSFINQAINPGYNFRTNRVSQIAGNKIRKIWFKLNLTSMFLK